MQNPPDNALVRALGFLDMGQHRRAAEELENFLAVYPQSGIAHASLASCRLQDGRVQDALEHARTAVGLDPDCAHCHVVLSCVLAESKAHRESRVAVQRACELEPYNASHWGMLGIRCLGTMRLREALEACERGLEIDPEDANSWSCRTSLLFFQDRRDEALKAARDNLSQNADCVSGHMMHGISLMHSGRVKEAEESFRESLRIEPENVHAQRLLRSTQGLERYVFKIIGALRDGPKLWLLPILILWLLLSHYFPDDPDNFFLPGAIALSFVRLSLLCSLIIPPGLSVIFSLALRQVDWPRALCWMAGLGLWSLPDLTDRFPYAPGFAVLFLFCSLSFHLSTDSSKQAYQACRRAGWSLLLPTLLLSLASLSGLLTHVVPVALTLGCCWCAWYTSYWVSTPKRQ